MINGVVADVAGLARHGLHDAMHHLQDIGEVRRRLGAGTPGATGAVAVVNTSAGGVPKRTVDRATVGYRGLDGDRQRTRKHHGRVWQAVCLWSSEVIESLATEGHPIGPGDAGENLTISGLDWSTLLLGTRLRVGGDAGPLLELTDWATPCRKIAASFTAREFSRVDVDLHRGWSRVYAKVLEDGLVVPGDPVRIVSAT